MFTIIELYNEEDTTINHHGFARDVADLKVESKFSYKEKVFKWAKIIGRFNASIYAMLIILLFIETKVVPVSSVFFLFCYLGVAIYVM